MLLLLLLFLPKTISNEIVVTQFLYQNENSYLVSGFTIYLASSENEIEEKNYRIRLTLNCSHQNTIPHSQRHFYSVYMVKVTFQ